MYFLLQESTSLRQLSTARVIVHPLGIWYHLSACLHLALHLFEDDSFVSGDA